MTVTLSPPQQIALDAASGQTLKIVDARNSNEYLLVPW
jgi:hypothetical protein